MTRREGYRCSVMAEMKTKETDASVDAFLDTVQPERRKRDGQVLCELMQRVTGFEPKMWGPSLVGFGRYHYKYESGREGDLFLTGFSPRKSALSVYIMPGFSKYGSLMDKLGKHKTGKSCLYINKLDDVNFNTLEELIRHSVDDMRRRHGV